MNTVWGRILKKYALLTGLVTSSSVVIGSQSVARTDTSVKSNDSANKKHGDGGGKGNGSGNGPMPRISYLSHANHGPMLHGPAGGGTMSHPVSMGNGGKRPAGMSHTGSVRPVVKTGGKPMARMGRHR